MQITKFFEFEAAHQLVKEGFNYGKCENVHGHSYKMQVHLFGGPGSDGMIMNFSHLKKLVKENIIDVVDHSYLNETMDALNKKWEVTNYDITTCETMSMSFASIIVKLLKGKFTNVEKVGITLFEQSDSSCYCEQNIYHFAEYF